MQLGIKTSEMPSARQNESIPVLRVETIENKTSAISFINENVIQHDFLKKLKILLFEPCFVLPSPYRERRLQLNKGFCLPRIFC